MSEPAIPALVAHRGHASRFPENTVVGLEAAIGCGIPYLELDVQMTADGVPVVLHDASLRRTAGDPRNIFDLRLDEVRGLSVAEVARLGPRFDPEPLPTLEAVVDLLAAHPGVGALVEVKRESAILRGEDDTVERVLAALAPVLERTVIISFVERVVMSARRRGAAATGWCLNYYDTDARRLAEAIGPDYLLTDHRRLPASGPLWRGPWSWGVWEVTDPELALALGARGVALVETMACAEMLEHPVLGRARREKVR